MIITQVAPIFWYDTMDVSPASKTLSQEASMLGIEPGVLPYGRLYEDSDEVGVKLLGPAGAVATWVFEKADTYGNEISGWRFTPTPETVHERPELEGYTLLIVND